MLGYLRTSKMLVIGFLENNKTQDEIAKFLDVDKSTYNKYENGKRKFNDDVVKELAEYYNIKVSDILD